MNWNLKIFTCCCALIVSASAFSMVKLPRLLSDGMVLQRDVQVRIWGWAEPGEKIDIRFNGKNYNTTGDGDGKWSIMLSPSKAGGPYTMEINASNKITIRDILVGEVWVCSGQSNMVLPMERVKYKYPNTIAHSKNTFIRQFFVPNNWAFTNPKDDLSSGKWESSDSITVLHFTATGYFFAKTLYERYHVPIGLINASVGGTPVTAWMSEDALQPFPSYLETAEKYKNENYVDSIRKSDSATSSNWYNNIWQQDLGLHGEKKWFDTGYDASSWRSMEVPGYWSGPNEKPINGVMWFRKTIDLPANVANKPAKLLLGRIIDRDSVYINGIFVGTTGYQYPPRIYNIPPGVLRQGKNILVVRVINSLGRGGFAEGKPYQLITERQTFDLSGDWRYQPGCTSGPLFPPTFFQYLPSVLYKGMLAPLLNYTIKGVIWYQGESNASKPGEYKDLFSAMIIDWRKKWKEGNFPFLFVQLPNFSEAKDQPSESNWAELREAQLRTLDIPNTGMAVAIDIGEWNDLHPLDKEDVGKRLALAAQKIAYADSKIVSSGPIYQSMKIEGNKIVISFTSEGSGLIAKDGNELKYFSIAGEDKKFVWANAKIQGNKVVVWNDSVQRPITVRYAWADNPEGANLYNRDGLPASPFTTDK